MGIFNSLFGSGGKKKTIVLVMIKIIYIILVMLLDVWQVKWGHLKHRIFK